jgi:hypothetical protein
LGGKDRPELKVSKDMGFSHGLVMKNGYKFFSSRKRKDSNYNHTLRKIIETTKFYWK